MPSLFQRRKILSSSAQALNPLAMAALTEWFDVASLASVGDGNPISSWVGARNLMTLTRTGTQRPTFVANDGDGRPAVAFDVVDDLLLSNSVSNASIYGSAGDCETWALVRCAAGNRGFFATNGASGMSSYLFTSGVFLDSPGSANRINSATGINSNTWCVLRFAKTGARRVIQADGVTLYDAVTTAGTWSTAAATWQIGDTAGVKFGGSIRHMMTFNSFLSDAEVTALNNYLATFR